MATKPKAKSVAFTSAKGTAQYPWLNKADRATRLQTVQVNLRVANDDAKPLMET